MFAISFCGRISFFDNVFYLYRPTVLFMRKSGSLFFTSYRIILIMLVSCFAAQNSYGQQSAANYTNDHLEALYDLLYREGQPRAATLKHADLKKSPGTHRTGTELLTPDSLIAAEEGTNEEATDTAGKTYQTSVAGNAAPISATSILIPGLPEPIGLPQSNSAIGQMKEALFDEETDLLINRFADMMEVDAEEVSNLSLYKFIDNWYGVKYKWGGADNTGIDCSAFSQKLYDNIYSVNILRTARQQHRSCELIKKYEDAVEGDLVFFRIHHVRISHVGVYLTNGYFVHASRSRGVMISSLNDKYWHRRYAGCGRIEKESRDAAESDFLQ